MKFNLQGGMPETGPRALEAFQAGINALQRNDPGEGERQFLKAAGYAPGWWMPRARLLDIYRQAGRHDEAMRENLALCRLVPDEIRPNYYNSLGARYTEQHNPAEALKAFEKAIELNPRYALPHANLASSYFKREEYDNAMREGQKALEIDPNLPDGKYL